MARKFSSSQFKSKVRQAQNKLKQAVNKYDREVKKHNQNVKKTVNQYNQKVRTHNSRVRLNRQRINSELAKLQRQPKSTRYVAFRSSVTVLHSTYVKLEERLRSEPLDSRQEYLLDLLDQENANSLEVMNVLSGTDAQSVETGHSEEELRNTEISNELSNISPDLDNRWRGALFSLSGSNPDAARHFCTSVREIFTQILEIKAPDQDVFREIPNCVKTDRGNPTRRSKIQYFLKKKGFNISALEEFIEQDINSIVQLFKVLSDATHGESGKFSMSELFSIKKRVEDGIIFLSNFAS